MTNREVFLASIKLIDLVLLATILQVVAFGLYALFIDSDPRSRQWLRTGDVDDLKFKLAGIVVVMLAFCSWKRSSIGAATATAAAGPRDRRQSSSPSATSSASIPTKAEQLTCRSTPAGSTATSVVELAVGREQDRHRPRRAKWAQTITTLTMIGTHRNIPAMPQIPPQTASETTIDDRAEVERAAHQPGLEHVAEAEPGSRASPTTVATNGPSCRTAPAPAATGTAPRRSEPTNGM